MFSGNGGQSWTFQNIGLFSCDTKSLLSFGGYIYVSTDENVFRSSDYGQNGESGIGLEDTYVKTITECNGTIYAGTYLKGVFASNDNGQTWTNTNNDLNAKYIYYFASDNVNVYAGTYLDGLFRSSDNGAKTEQKSHAEDYMIFPENIGEYLSIDEVALSQGELYTFVTNKNGKGKKGTMVASIKGTLSADIVQVLEKLPLSSRKLVKEITLDMAKNMESAVRVCLLNADSY